MINDPSLFTKVYINEKHGEDTELIFELDKPVRVKLGPVISSLIKLLRKHYPVRADFKEIMLTLYGDDYEDFKSKHDPSVDEAQIFKDFISENRPRLKKLRQSFEETLERSLPTSQDRDNLIKVSMMHGTCSQDPNRPNVMCPFVCPISFRKKE